MEKSIIVLYILIILVLVLQGIILYFLLSAPKPENNFPIYVVNLDLGSVF